MKPRILLVHSGRERRRRTCVLRALGATVTTKTPARAAELLAENGRLGRRFDIVVAPLEGPEPCGLCLVSRARALGSTTPFVIITGFGDEASRATLAELRDVVLVEEPLDEGRLQALIEEMTETRGVGT